MDKDNELGLKKDMITKGSDITNEYLGHSTKRATKIQ